MNEANDIRKPYGLRALRVAAVVALLVSISGCASDSIEPGPSSVLLAPEQFESAMADPAVIAIDVHTPAVEEIPDTDLTVAFDQLETNSALLPPNRSTKLAIYCRTGRMSALAATALTALGYSDVIELSGGTDAWTESGRTLVPIAPG